MNIVESLHDPRFFFETLKGQRSEWTWTSWEVFLKALFGLPITSPAELELLRECTGLEAAPTERAREAYCICGRRSGKSFMSAVIAVYLACFKDWRKVLSPGETGWVFVLSVDKMQAGVIKNYITAILGSSPSFRKLVKNETRETIELRNGVSIAVKTSSFRSVRGYTLLAAVLEELAFWRSEDSASPDKEVLAALRPALATVPDSLLIGISTPYSRSGALWEAFKDHFGHVDAPLVWKSESLRMNPTLNPATIQEALSADWEAASAEWLAMFRADIQAFIGHELIDAVTVPGRYELPRADGVQYHAFADPSGGRQDSFALAIGHRNAEGRAVLDVLHERRPPFSPEAVTLEFADVLKTYGLFKVVGDKYAGEWVAESFKKAGVIYQAAEKTASELYLEFLPMLTSGAVEVLDDKRLRSQFAGLERRARGGGKDLITHYPGGHDDLANAAAGALVIAAGQKELRKGKVYFGGKRIGPPVSPAAVTAPPKPPEPYVGPRRGKVYIPGKSSIAPGRDRDRTPEEEKERQDRHDRIVEADMARARRFPEHPEDE